MIAFSIFTRFWCTLTEIQSKPSSNFALRHGLPTLIYKTCAHKHVDLTQFFSDRLTYAADNAKARCNFMFFGYTWFTHKQKTETVLSKWYFQWVRRYLPRPDYHESLSSLNIAWMWVTRNLNTDKLNCNFFIFSNVKSNVLDCCRSVFGKVQMSDLFF